MLIVSLLFHYLYILIRLRRSATVRARSAVVHINERIYGLLSHSTFIIIVLLCFGIKNNLLHECSFIHPRKSNSNSLRTKPEMNDFSWENKSLPHYYAINIHAYYSTSNNSKYNINDISYIWIEYTQDVQYGQATHTLLVMFLCQWTIPKAGDVYLEVIMFKKGR